MNVSIALESRFVRTPDGAIWSLGWLDGAFWQRYLQVFDEVRVIARVCDVASPPNRAARADAAQVVFAALPYYVGPWQYAAKYLALKEAAAQAMPWKDALILRTPGFVSALIAKIALRKAKPFGVEVVGDPADVFRGGVRSVLAPLARRLAIESLKSQCANACSVAYVSPTTLSLRYPPHPAAFVTEYSSITLTDEAFTASPRRFDHAPSPLQIITVGSLEQLYKGQDTLIRALAAATGLMSRTTPGAAPPQLSMIGGGRRRCELEKLASAVGMSGSVNFLGQLPPGGAVRAELDRAHIFILPSLQEGLPRSMIEAMARGLPCIGSTVGGIPDLLHADELVAHGDANALAEKIVQLAGDPSRLSRLSRTNFEKARDYLASTLGPRRVAMYQVVRDRTQEWIDRAGRRNSAAAKG